MNEVENNAVDRPQQYLTYAADESPTVKLAISTLLPVGALALAPWDLGGLATRAFILGLWGLLAGAVLSRGYRVRSAAKTARAADSAALVIPLRAIVVDPARSGGKYWEEALACVTPDGNFVWRALDSPQEHRLTPEQIDDIRVEHPQLPSVYPHITIAEAGGAQLWLYMMKPRLPMTRVGATHLEMEEAAVAIRDRVTAGKSSEG